MIYDEQKQMVDAAERTLDVTLPERPDGMAKAIFEVGFAAIDREALIEKVARADKQYRDDMQFIDQRGYSYVMKEEAIRRAAGRRLQVERDLEEAGVIERRTPEQRRESLPAKMKPTPRMPL